MAKTDEFKALEERIKELEKLLKADTREWVKQNKRIKALEEENERLRTTIEGALRIKDLWLITQPVNEQHQGEAEALSRMKFEFEQALNGKLCVCCEEITEENAHLHRNCGK